MSKSGSVFNVDGEKGEEDTISNKGDGVHGWCGSKHLVPIAAVSSVIVYLIGAIISGVTYRVYSVTVPINCTLPEDRFVPTPMTIYPIPWVVVGPCFMSAGGAILVFLMFQWCFCRPLTRM